jgi:hypothetical protein
MSDNKESRGRGRGRSRPNYRNKSTIRRETDKQQEEAKQIELNKTTRKENAPKPDQSKITKVIEKGKQLVDNFFKGIYPTQRGNIKVELDDRTPDRIADAYLTRIEQHVYEEKHDQQKTKAGIEYDKDLFSNFLGAMNIGMAIKLATAADTDQRIYLGGMDTLKEAKITLPNKAGTLLDCIGITDLKDDNKIRIYNQALVAKRQAVRGIIRIYGKNEISKFIIDPTEVDDFINRSNGDTWIHGMIDSKIHSVDRVKEYSKWQFIERTKNNFTFKIGSTGTKIYTFKLPSFDFENVTQADVKKYFANSIFDDFEFNQKEALTICAFLVLQLIEKPWLINLSKTIKQLTTTGIHVLIDDFTLQQVFDECGLWNVNKYLSDADLNDIISGAIHKWNDGYAREMNNFLNVSQLNFTKFGTEAQLVEIDNKYISTDDNHLGFRNSKIFSNSRSTTKMKLHPSDAMIGVACRFVDRVDMTNDFNINHTSNNFSILRQFVANDFK